MLILVLNPDHYPELNLAAPGPCEHGKGAILDQKVAIGWSQWARTTNFQYANSRFVN